MSKIIFFICVFTSIFFFSLTKSFSQESEQACSACHSLADVLPDDHEPVTSDKIDVCSECHQRITEAEVNPYSTKIHISHLDNADCLVCHDWEDGKVFGVKGAASFGSPDGETYEVIKDEIMPSWASSKNLDHIHALNSVSCGGCHGAELPEFYAKVPNDRCLTCHGPIEKLVEKTVGEVAKERNVHKSKHYGVELECIVCHRGHMPSKILCLDCHKNFDLKPIPAQE